MAHDIAHTFTEELFTDSRYTRKYNFISFVRKSEFLKSYEFFSERTNELIYFIYFKIRPFSGRNLASNPTRLYGNKLWARPRDRGFISGGNARTLSLGVKWSVRETDLSSGPSAEVKKQWS